ncbi:3'(2'),5'-bisphosphate nucleotidase CysQ [Methyloligella halotolerans]|uniref:3'(2'),5'-bisphosphate nucleotidase CysQ n=1 Tax=Methyloligella halotolerans TaxID=1177755 RepID=A0A1E2RZS2_9HYPH|nr:3'(2'),5'-bisphosphate nucleotidase CysQ [Methyloligella halotolerans]ODA67711.1 3'(2'),5'-bisphosphate nucleotidase CysQ [Methyloligella halotolerans]
MKSFDFERACEMLLVANCQAGAAIMRHYRSDAGFERKGDNTPVTMADRDADAILLAVLREIDPEIPVVSEESASELDRERGSQFFLVDPLDGTKEFIKRRTDFTVNVALIEEGVPVFGMVFAPARKEVAFTIAEHRAVAARLDPDRDAAEQTLNAQPITVRDVPPEGITAMVSASHFDDETEDFLKDLPIAERHSAGSSLKFIQLAQGKADLYPRFGPTMEWDTAAADAILRAAGGSVVTIDGNPLRYGKWNTGLKNPAFIAWGRKPV